MSQFDTLSPVFKESLRAVADSMLAKKAQMGGIQCGPDQPEKQAVVQEVLNKVNSFSDRFVKEWLYGMDEQEMQKVSGLFDEINGLSVPEACELMAKSGECCPFGLVASMFGGATEGGDVEIVVEQEPSVPPPTEKGPPAETQQEQEPDLLNTLIGQR